MKTENPDLKNLRVAVVPTETGNGIDQSSTMDEILACPETRIYSVFDYFQAQNDEELGLHWSFIYDVNTLDDLTGANTDGINCFSYLQKVKRPIAEIYKEIKLGNQLFAEYLGAYHEEGQPANILTVPIGDDEYYIDLDLEDSAKFLTSWDWIIPVAEKFVSTLNTEGVKDNAHYNKIHDALWEFNIESLFNALVNAITNEGDQPKDALQNNSKADNPRKTYILFGANAVKEYDETGSVKIENFELEGFDANPDVVDRILDIAQGWEGYLLITEEEYNRLKIK